MRKQWVPIFGRCRHARLVSAAVCARIVVSITCLTAIRSGFASGAQFKLDDSFAVPLLFSFFLAGLWTAAAIGVAIGLVLRFRRIGLSVLGAMAPLALYYGILVGNWNDQEAVDVHRINILAACLGPGICFLGLASARLAYRYRWRGLLIAGGIVICTVALVIGAIAISNSGLVGGSFGRSPLPGMLPLGLVFAASVVYTLWPRS